MSSNQPAPDFLTRSAPMIPTTVNPETRTLDATLSVESPVKVYDWQRGQMIDEVLLISGAQFGRQVPLLDSHTRSGAGAVLGSVRAIRGEGDKLAGQISFAADSQSADTFGKYRDGHMTDFSIGYRVDPRESVTVEPGESRSAFGRQYSREKTDLPLRVVNRWQLFEVSAVAVGADPAAKARSLDFSQMEETRMDKDFVKFLSERGIDAEKLDESQRSAWQKIFDAQRALDELKKTPETGEAARASTDPITVDFKAEAARLVKESLDAERAARAELSGQIRTAIAGTLPAELVETLARECDTIDSAKARALDYLRQVKTPIGSPAIHVGIGRSDLTADHLTARMMVRTGMEKAALADFGEEVVSQARKYAPDNLVDLARAAMAMDGREVPAGREDMIRLALSEGARGASTFTLTNVLGNIANKSLLRGYTELPETWSQWVSVGSVSDFKTQTAVAAAYSLAPEQVGSDGKIKHGTMSDAAESYRIYTYAKMFSVNREQFINDDLGAFTEIPTRMGKAYGQMQSDNIYAHLLANGTLADGYDLCGTDHANYISGTDTALTSTYAIGAISAALVKFMSMTDRDGHSISVMPKYLLVPPALNSAAQEVYKGSALTGVSTNKSPNINIHAGSYQVITEPRLSNSSITGYSTTAWYMLADPAATETLKVFFLNGNRAPIIEQVPVAGDTLGYSWRVYGDMGVKAMDYRGIVKSAGA